MLNKDRNKELTSSKINELTVGDIENASIGSEVEDIKMSNNVNSPAASSNKPSNIGMPRALTYLFRVIVLVLAIAVWQLATALHLIKPVVSKTPMEVWSFFLKISNNGVLWSNTADTMEAVIISFVIASIVGIIIGIGLALLPRVELILSVYIDALNAMPRIALAPVFILYFGIGLNAKIALAFSLVVFILMSSSRSGIKMVDRDIMLLAEVMNLKKWEMFVKILLPTSIPAIFSGLRLGMIYALLGVVTSEIIAAQNGLGTLISNYSNLFETSGVYAILIVLAIIATIINLLMNALERHLLRWQR